MMWVWESFFNGLDTAPSNKVDNSTRFWRSRFMIWFSKKLGRFSSWLWNKMWNRRHRM